MGFKLFSTSFVCFLSLILALKIYMRIANDTALSAKSVCLIIAFIAVLSFHNKTTWIAGIVLFLWGLFNLFFTASKAAEPTIMQFTEPLFKLWYSDNGRSVGHKLIGTIPELFCALGLVIFLTPYVRQKYQIIKVGKRSR